MSCLTCGSIPCCCAQEVVCPEAITYAFENANLAGVGVFDEVQGDSPTFTVRMRGIASADLSLVTVVFNNVTNAIEIGFNTSAIKAQQTFTDNAARLSATPVFLGQLGFQINTAKLYYGSSLVAGGWTLVSAP